MRSRLLPLVSMFIIISCSSDDPVTPDKREHIFVAGGSHNNTVAGVWVDDAFIKLVESDVFTICTDVFATQDDVYACGWTQVNGKFEGDIWKNGGRIPFSKGDFHASLQDIVVSDKDVYVDGQIKESGDPAFHAAYWKNGHLSKLEDVKASAAMAIKVKGDNVYVVGWARFPLESAMLWVNGVPTRLNSEEYRSFATGIEVVGNDIYVTGRSEDALGGGKALYWKNGVEYSLTSVNVNGAATDIFVDGDDVYFSGDLYTLDSLYMPVYWKNGVLTTLGDYDGYNLARAIFVKDGDVYVTGTYGSRTKHSAVYWKNGNRVVLSPDTSVSYTQSIFVK